MKPAWRAIAGIDGSGHLWMEPTAAPGGPQVFDVFDPEGRYLGQVPSPVKLAAPPLFVGERLYGVTLDEDGIPYVVRARIVRR